LNQNTPTPVWDLGPLGWLAPALAEEVTRTGAALGQSFAAQFSDPAHAGKYFQSLRRARAALHDACWPSPTLKNMLAAPAHDLASLSQRLDHAMNRMPALRAPIAPVRVQIPNRQGELQDAWRAAPRTRPLGALAERLAELTALGMTPLLFGSLAEPGPWPAYADVDLAVLIDRRAAADPSALERLVHVFERVRPLLCQIDPLQHHGPYILFESDADCYLESLLPAATLRRATTLGAPALELALTPVEDRLFSLLALLGAMRGALDLAARPARLGDRFSAKYLCSLVLLLPALACACLGKPTEKSLSFAQIKTELGPREIETLEGFERLRREWRWTLAPPRVLLTVAGRRAHFVARNVNRWPAPTLARWLAAGTPRLPALFNALLERIVRQAREGATP